MQFSTNLPAAEAHKLLPLRNRERHALPEPSPAPAPRPPVLVPIRAAERRARRTGHAHA
jgi:hypothetical protein